MRIFLHEKSIADQSDERIYDMTPVGEQRQWKHLKMNPWGETPTVQRFIVVDEHEPENLIYDPNFLGFARTTDFVLIQVTSTVGNGKKLKFRLAICGQTRCPFRQAVHSLRPTTGTPMALGTNRVTKGRWPLTTHLPHAFRPSWH